jgi:hypothetical protein
MVTGRPVVSSTMGTTIDFNFSLVNITLSATIPTATKTRGMARTSSQILAFRLMGIGAYGDLCSGKYR